MNPISDKHTTPGFEDMNLEVGTKLQLLLQRNEKQFKYFTSLIGYVMGEYLLVRIPVENGSPVALEAGEKLVVKGFSGICVFSFDCLVKKQLPSPFAFVQLSFPLTVQSTAFRAAVRVRVSIPAQVYTAGTDNKEHAIPVTLTNLSADGALIEAKENIGDLHNMVRLSFAFLALGGEDEIRVDTKATIRNAKPKKATAADETRVFVYGVQFERLERSQQAGLQNFIHKN